MLTPRAYRAALLDELTASPAELLPAVAAADTPRDSAVPSRACHEDAQRALRLARSTAPQHHVRRERDAAPASTSASTAGSHSAVEERVEPSSHTMQTQAEQHDRSALQRRVAHAMATSAPTHAAPGVEADQNRSIILSFIDACNASGVPAAVIAEQVQFMVSSMRESLALHAALHARQHKDRIREYELEELAATLERQQLQFSQHLQLSASLAMPSVDTEVAPASSYVQPQLTPPPPLAHVDAAGPAFAPRAVQHLPEEEAWRDGGARGAHAFRYASLTQRSSPNAAAGRFEKSTAPAGAPPADRRGSTLSAGPAAASSVPVSTWQPRAPAQSTPAATERARAGTRARTATSSVPTPHHTTLSSSARPAHPRGSGSCRHGSHHKLCNVCYAAASAAPAAAPRVSFADGAATATHSAAAARDRRTPPRRTRYTPHQNYMRPTHASLARREPRSHSTSPQREITPRSPCSDVRAGAGDSPWQGSHKGNTSVSTANAEHVYNSAAPRRLLVRSTLSRRLRAAQAAPPHAEASRASSRAPTPQRSRSAKAEGTARPRTRDAPARASIPRYDPWSHISTEEDVHEYSHHPHDRVPDTGSGFVFPATASTSATDSVSDAAPRRAVGDFTGSGDGAEERAEAAHAARPRGAAPVQPVVPTSWPSSANGSIAGREAASEVPGRPRRPPPPVAAAPTPAPVVLVVDLDSDATGDVPVCVTSPELQHFLERSQRKLRETERVLTRQSPTSAGPHPRVPSVSHLTQSPSPIVAAELQRAAAHVHAKPVSSRGLLDSSTATTLPTPTQPSILDGVTTAAAGWSANSLDAVRARQQQRLAELHRRLSAYETPSAARSADEDEEKSISSRRPSHDAAAAALAEGIGSRSLSPTASSVFRPHDVAAAKAAAAVYAASPDHSPLVQISPTSSDEDSDVADG